MGKKEVKVKKANKLILKKEGQVWDTIIPWIIGIGILIIGLIVYGILFDKGSGIISYLKDLMRFGK